MRSRFDLRSLLSRSLPFGPRRRLARELAARCEGWRLRGYADGRWWLSSEDAELAVDCESLPRLADPGSDLAATVRQLPLGSLLASRLRWPEDASRLAVRLAPASALAQRQLRDVACRWLEGVPAALVYGLRHPFGHAAIPGRLLDGRVTASALHEAALGEIEWPFPSDLLRPVLDQGAIRACHQADGLEASGLLALPALLGEGESLAAVLPDEGTLTLVPSRWCGEHRVEELVRRPLGEPPLLPPLRITRAGIELLDGRTAS